MPNNILNKFSEIEIVDPVDEVITQFHNLIKDGLLKPGDKLPSDRKLETKLGIPKGVINRAIRMMETYGIVNTVPQSGTYISTICVEALDGLMINIISLKRDDIDSIEDVRHVLEKFAAERFIKYASDEDIDELIVAHENFKLKLESDDLGFDSDFVFHLKLASFSQSPVLNSILTKQVVNMMDLLEKYSNHLDKKLVKLRLENALSEHKDIIAALSSRDTKKALEAIDTHFNNARSFRDKHK